MLLLVIVNSNNSNNSAVRHLHVGFCATQVPPPVPEPERGGGLQARSFGANADTWLKAYLNPTSM